MIVEKILYYFQNLPEPAGYKEMRMKDLTGKSHLLFLDDKGELRDCCDADETSSVGSCDLVQDYKRSTARNKSGGTSSNSVSSPDSGALRKNTMPPTTRLNGRFNSTESLNSIASSSEIDEIGFDVIAVTKSSNFFSVALAVMYQRLVTLFVQILDQSNCSLVERGVSEGSADAEEEETRSTASSQETKVQLRPMAHPRCSCGAVNFNGKLIIAGGYDRGECMKSVEEYDPELNQWRPLPPMKEERGRFDGTVCDGKVYALGGCNGNSDLSSAECFDPDANKWSYIPSMKLVKSNNGCCTLGERVYSIGGWNGKVGIRECERYDPAKGEWEFIAPMTTKRYQAGICAWKGSILAVGGCDAWNCLNTLECYEEASNVWKPLSPMSTPRRGCGVGVIQDKLYVVGGSDGSHSLSSVEVFDLLEGTWAPGPALRTPRANVHCVSVGNRLYAVGGFNGKSFLSTIEYFDPVGQEWRTWTLLDSRAGSRRNTLCSQDEEEEQLTTPRGSEEIPSEIPVPNDEIK